MPIFSPILGSKEFFDFNYQFERKSLKYLSLAGFVVSLFFLVLDSLRVNDYLPVVILRGSAVLVFATGTYLTSSSLLKPKELHQVIFFISSFCYISTFMLDWFADMPIYFLMNALVIYLFAFNTVLSFGYKIKIIQTIMVCLFYSFYAYYLSVSPEYHLAGIANMVTVSTVSLIIGNLFDRYKLENYLQHVELEQTSKKMEQLNALKTKLISVFSHDLAGPLTTIRGLLDLSEQNLLTPEETSGLSKTGKQSLDGIIGVQKNLLNWSRYQLDGFKSQKATVKLHELISTVIDGSLYISENKGLKINNGIPIDYECTIHVEVLRMVVRNFLSNAIKYSHENGIIEVNMTTLDNEIAISVTDFGTGMSEAQVEKIFSLEKESEWGTNGERGSGIGLIIAKDFAEMIGGDITVISEYGKGSQFTLILPDVEDPQTINS
ncbi:MAG: HAMP domain-containing histidine kinase [Cyclobacteriaceae bacterium]